MIVIAARSLSSTGFKSSNESLRAHLRRGRPDWVAAEDGGSRRTSASASGSMDPHRGPACREADVWDRISRVIPFLERLLGAPSGTLREPTELLPPVAIEPKNLDRILIELALTARHGATVGDTLTWAAEPTTRLVPSEHRPGGPEASVEEVLIRLWDTKGPPDPNHLRGAFNRPITVSGPAHGSGMGTATTAGVVQASGGRFEVDYLPSGGTCFRVYLPTALPGPGRPDFHQNDRASDL